MVELDNVDKADFLDKTGVTEVLVKQICSGCEAEDCGGCEGDTAIIELEAQIIEDGIKYMKELAMKFGGANA